VRRYNIKKIFYFFINLKKKYYEEEFLERLLKKNLQNALIHNNYFCLKCISSSIISLFKRVLKGRVVWLNLKLLNSLQLNH